jgi:hypothetical protein
MKLLTNKTLVLGIATSALMALCGQANAANLVVNGDFDNVGSVFVNNTGYGSDDLQTGGATDIPSWNNVPGFANEFWTAPENSYYLTASPSNGSGYFVDLTGQQNNKPYGGIEQTIATTPGQKYVLKFDLGASTTYNGPGVAQAALTASAGGASTLFTLNPIATDQWQSETLEFTATGSSTTVEFLADSDYTSRYTGLDNVSVSVSGVPEAPMWAMMIAGIGGIGLLLRREKKAKRLNLTSNAAA